MRVVTIKFKVPRFDKEARKWARETLEQVNEEIGMFDYEDYDLPFIYTLSYKGRKAGTLVITEQPSAKEKRETVNN